MKKHYNIINVIIIVVSVTIFFLLYQLFFSNQINGIILDKDFVKIYETYSDKLEIKINPEDVKTSLIWSSSNPNVAVVNNEGIVLGLKNGIARVSVSTEDGKVSTSCIVLVMKREIKDIVLFDNEININVGEEKQIITTIIPEALKNERINWSSSNQFVAEVDSTGKIRGLAQGISEIKAELFGVEKTLVAYIGDKIGSIRFKNDEIKIDKGKSQELEININPEGAINEVITWESSNPNIVEVDNKGNIIAKDVGVATITVTTEYTKLKDTCEVIVNKEKFEVVYTELNQTEIKEDGTEIGELPTIKKYGYKFLGWYTEKTGGKMISEKTIVESNITLYPHWEKMYIITDDVKKQQGYNLITAYGSETLKYKILKKDRNYFVIIWVDNAYEQLKSALAYPSSIGFLPADTILNNEIKNKGYQNKGLVSVNASFTWYHDLGSPVVINDGKLIIDVEDKQYRKGEMYPVLALKKDGYLTTYSFRDHDYSYNMKTRNQMLEDGIRDIFVISGGTDGGGTSVAHRTQICQVDKNNFVLFSGNGKVRDCGNKTKAFGCSSVYNLDGGGSRKLYYKTNTSSVIRIFGGSRPRPDMLYFVEK